MKWYNLFHKAWSDHPPIDWLGAAYLGYKAPNMKNKEAQDNTRRMADMLRMAEMMGKKPQ